MSDASGKVIPLQMVDDVRDQLQRPVRDLRLSVIARDLLAGELVVDGLVVRSDRRGERIGAALMRALLDEARARGYTEVRLDVIGENIWARALYDRLGFVVTQRQESRLTRLIFNYRSALVMVRQL